MQLFVHAHASAGGSQELLDKLQAQLGSPVAGGNLGFLYVTDCLAGEFGIIAERLRRHTGVKDWVGTVGLGLCAEGVEIYDGPAASLMIVDIAPEQYSLFHCSANMPDVHIHNPDLDLRQDTLLGIAHGNPMAQQFMDTFMLCCTQLPTAFFVGGLSSSNFAHPQMLNRPTDSVVSGVLLSSQARVIVSHTQGCTPLSQKHEITQCEHNVIQQIDNRPALEVFREDIGEVLAKDLERAGGYIYAGFPIQGSDVNDYIVRNLVGFDLSRQQIMVGDFVHEGQALMFCRRDGNSAREDLERMLQDIQQRLTTPAKGALYYSCLGRGRYQFGENSEELKAIAQALPDVPLTGFFANGEIYNDKLYGYTGVLTVFH